MSYVPRIHAQPEYLQALGQAVYNFTYLEWVVVWTIVKLSADGFGSVPKGESASKIATALNKALSTTTPPLPAKLRTALFAFEKSYRKASSLRNKLFHAHPYTAAGGAQQLGGGGFEWPLEKVNDAAKQFEDAAIEGNAIFHGPLSEARP